MKRKGVVAVGGTFDRLHKGHMALLLRALREGDRVLVGVTTDEFVGRLGKVVDETFQQRVSNVRQFLDRHGKGVEVEIAELNEYFGPAIFTEDVEVIVVSEETLHRVQLANRSRRKQGLKPLKVEVVSMVLAQDGKPISSNRIRRGEIDAEGRLLKASGGKCYMRQLHWALGRLGRCGSQARPLGNHRY